MIVAVLTLCVCVLVLIIVLGLVIDHKDRATEEYVGGEAAAHAKCIAHVASFVGNQFAADVLEAAAHDFDSLEEKGNMKALARMKFTADGPSMPAIWLHDRANRILGLED